MKHRNPFVVLLLMIFTLGIYPIYWIVTTKGEMKQLGADIPTAWLLIVPFVSWWWYWKYSKGVEHVTGGKLSGVLTFLLIMLLGGFGCVIIQASFNEVAGTPAATAMPGGMPPTNPMPTTYGPAPQPMVAPQMAPTQQPPMPQMPAAPAPVPQDPNQMPPTPPQNPPAPLIQ